MTPEEKANELIEKFGELASDVAEEVINSNPLPHADSHSDSFYDRILRGQQYWQQVLSIIQNK